MEQLHHERDGMAVPFLMARRTPHSEGGARVNLGAVGSFKIHSPSARYEESGPLIPRAEPAPREASIIYRSAARAIGEVVNLGVAGSFKIHSPSARYEGWGATSF